MVADKLQENYSPKVACVTAVFPPYWAGTGNVAYYNALEIARRGYRVQVFTARYPNKGYSDPAEFPVHRLWTPIRFGNAPLTPGLISALPPFDLIHLHWPFIFGAELTWFLANLYRIPLVMTYHLDLLGDRKRIFGFYQSIWGPVLARAARKVIAVTSDHLESSQIYPILQRRPEVITEVPNGVDTRLFNPEVSGNSIRARYNIPEGDSVILFVGALDKAHEYKGVPDLIQAFAGMNDPHVWLLLVGGGELTETYQSIAAQLPNSIQKQVIFTGPVPHEQLPAYYSAADIGVLPSRQPESFGMVLIEAMACGKPVIASSSPGVRSVVLDGQEGLLTRPGDALDLTQKLQTLVGNPQLRQRMGERALQKVKDRYSWARVGDLLDAVYREVLSTSLDARQPFTH